MRSLLKYQTTAVVNTIKFFVEKVRPKNCASSKKTSAFRFTFTRTFLERTEFFKLVKRSFVLQRNSKELSAPCLDESRPFIKVFTTFCRVFVRGSFASL